MTSDDQLPPLLQQALDIITIERNAAEHTWAFAAAGNVISAFGERDLVNCLFEEIT